ncbi:hypothetical protein [Longimicrobium sp.]|uniref:hypothetical protein n=1 Tax=Longimicrobium sp. TaxID=2029185 RepID=UPI002E322AA1|nr:hypothetical protein [Longimicrobium sp.]HEX6037701.1 hypothetical protein [Longimicrobium sp.]
MTTCRDCSRPTPASARSCPHCGILNPVVQWVAYPDGSHHTARVAPDPAAAAAALSGKPAPRPAMPAPARPSAPRTPTPTPASASAGASAPFGASAGIGASAPYETSTSSGSSAPYGGSAPAETHAPYGGSSGASAASDPFALFASGGAAALPLAAAPVEDFAAEIEAINRCSTAFFWLAGLNAALGLLFREVGGDGLLVDAGIMAALSFALRRFRSRVAAGLLVLYAGFTVYTKVTALLAGAGAVGWIWMWVLITGMAVKATLATVKLNEQKAAGALA